jgi:dienelactone hydrolase
MKPNQLFLLLAASIVFIACNNKSKSTPAVKEEITTPKLKEENLSYFQDNTTLKGYIVYDSSTDKKRPAVLVVHEWWGMNDYPKMRARKLAALGYVAMAVDLYGNGTIANNPDDAQKMAMPFYQDPKMAKTRLEIFIHALKQYSEVDTNNIAAIGYCFGGGVLLNTARLGEDLKGVVSFHGSLVGTPADKNLLKAKLLVCHGADDKFVLQPEVEKFKRQMDSIGADYTFKQYAGATHAFSNPAATAMGQKFNIPIAYNAAADSASWNDMKEFFGRIFK